MRVKFICRSGDDFEVRLVGDHDELGEWSPDRAIPMVLEEGEKGQPHLWEHYVDLPAGTASLHFDLRPAMPDPPALGLRVGGKLAAPERVPELADVIRWRAEHPVLP